MDPLRRSVLEWVNRRRHARDLHPLPSLDEDGPADPVCTALRCSWVMGALVRWEGGTRLSIEPKDIPDFIYRFVHEWQSTRKETDDRRSHHPPVQDHRPA